MLPIARSQNPPHKTVRPTVVACVAPLAFALTFAFTLACEGQDTNRNAAAARPLSSLLAVGDTGDRWGPLPWLFEGQLAVGTAMRREHARAPVDALMLLGDNFYPDGLLATELVPRIVENVARPYCAFIDPSAELRPFLDGRCDRRR